MSEWVAQFGAVVFVENVERAARFYKEVFALEQTHIERSHALLQRGECQIVIHAISGGGSEESALNVREDAANKLFFLVESIEQARHKAQELGGKIFDPKKEWSARGFTACDGYDPEGNVIQVRQKL